jgi:hypothetical protein
MNGSGLKRIAASGLAAMAAYATPAMAQSGKAPITLVCSASGLAKHGAGLSEAALCSRFTAPVAAALKAKVNHGATLPVDPKARWIRIAVRLDPRGRAEALLTSKLHGEATNYPLLAVQVMDKPLQLREIDRLARHVAATLAAGKKPVGKEK